MPRPPGKRPLIRILFPAAGNGRNLDLIRTICEVSTQRQRWMLDFVTSASPAEFLALHRQQPADGVIAFPTMAFRDGPLHRLGVPTLAILSADGPLPVVRPDDVEVGRLAARHLGQRGWTPVAVSVNDSYWWRERVAGWHELLPGSQVTALPLHQDVYLDWLRRLPPRTAIFASNDQVAAFIARLAPQAGRHVGRDLRILGVDDGIDCFFVSPPLSSIRLPLRALGALAVATMAKLLAGRVVPPIQCVPPLGIAVRGSSDPFATTEPWLQELAEAVKLSLAHGRRPHLQRLLAACGRSRSTVDRAWRKAAGCSMMASIQSMRRDLIAARVAEGATDQIGLARAVGLRSAKSLKRLLRSD